MAANCVRVNCRWCLRQLAQLLQLMLATPAVVPSAERRKLLTVRSGERSLHHRHAAGEGG